LAPPAPLEAGSVAGLPPPQALKADKHISARIAARRTLNIRRFLYFLTR
jgi:hypothetical protein